MEEKKDRTTEENIPQQGEDLSEQDKEILAEIDREDMDEMDRKAQDALGADEWIHVDFTLDYDTALEGLKLAARMLLESQRSLQTVAFGIVITTFIWPAISGGWRDPAILIVGIVTILACIYGIYAAWHFPKVHRLQNARKMADAQTPWTMEIFPDHVMVREGDETTLLEFTNKSFKCYDSGNVLLFVYNRLDIIIVPKAALGEQEERVRSVLKAKLMAKYITIGTGAVRFWDKVKNRFGKHPGKDTEKENNPNG